MHQPGHGEDCLYLAPPLRGDFVFECELDAQAIRVGYAGQQVGFKPRKGDVFDLVHPGGRVASTPITPPVENPGQTCKFRMELSQAK